MLLCEEKLIEPVRCLPYRWSVAVWSAEHQWQKQIQLQLVYDSLLHCDRRYSFIIASLK